MSLDVQTRKRSGPSLVVVLGAGGTGLLLADCISRVKGFKFTGFLDDDLHKQEQGYEGLRVLGSLNTWRRLDARVLFVNSLYGPKKMRSFYELVESLGIPSDRWATIIDPRAVVCSGARIGKGSFVGPGSVVEPAVVLGHRCALLGNVYLAHHAALGEYVACANSVSIAGGVRIGAASFVGANASIREDPKHRAGRRGWDGGGRLPRCARKANSGW